MANAMTLPADIVSNPSLSHVRLNFAMAPRSFIRQLDPARARVSYSGPSIIVPAKGPSFISIRLPHARGQE